MSWLSKGLGKLGGFLSNPLGSIMGGLGAQNKYNPAEIQTDPSLSNALVADRTRSGGMYGAQQQYADFLRNQALGGPAPNPAQSMFQNAVNQNIQNAQAQIASAKGVNRAQAARMGANAALQANQQAANNAATMRAQQQLGAQDQYAQMLAGMGAQGLQQQGINQTALAQQNAAQNTRAGIQAGVSGQNAQINAQALGGLLSGGGSAMSLAGMAMAHGGVVPGFADGGSVGDFETLDQGLAGSDQWFNGPTSSPQQQSSSKGSQGGSSFKDLGKGSMDTMLSFMRLGKGMSTGGPVPPYMPESRLGRVSAMLYDGGRAASFESGGGVGGHAVVAGDSPRNDHVPALLSPGEIVIPRSHASSPEAAADFVRALQAHGYAEGGEVKDEPSFGDAVRRWWSDRSEEASRTVADTIHSALPDWLSARRAVKQNQARRDAAYEASKE